MMAQRVAINNLADSYMAFNTNYHDTGLFGFYATADPKHQAVDDLVCPAPTSVMHVLLNVHPCMRCSEVIFMAQFVIMINYRMCTYDCFFVYTCWSGLRCTSSSSCPGAQGRMVELKQQRRSLDTIWQAFMCARMHGASAVRRRGFHAGMVHDEGDQRVDLQRH